MRSMIAFVALCALSAAPVSAGQLSVTGVSPSPRIIRAPIDGVIRVTFDQPVDAKTVTPRSFHAFGRWSGPVNGTRTLSEDGRTITLTPDQPLSSGERVMVIVANTLRSTDGDALRPGGYSWQFWTAAKATVLQYDRTQTMTTRTSPGVTTRSYGGVATDLNDDGYPDLSIVNEDSADLRIFLNAGDGDAMMETFAQPTTPLGQRASPSEPADLNLDGAPDLCVVNIDPDTLSVLFGDNQGSLIPQSTIPIGQTPRGVTVLDADGDGDVDVVTTSFGLSDLALLINNGDGTFAPPVRFDTGFVGEWAIEAADLNGDGLLDLAVGCRSARRVVSMLSQGDGTFTVAGSAVCGTVWQLSTGDLDGDGDDDIVTVDSTNNNGSVILNDGSGLIARSQTVSTDAFPLASDIGDVDGDGDLDWVTSSFSGDWLLFTNDGAGAFAFNQEFAAPRAGSCALLVDLDNDRDLDLALVDELEDVLIIERSMCPADWDDNGTTNAADVGAYLSDYFQDLVNGTTIADYDGNGETNTADVGAYLTDYFAILGAC